MASSRSRAAAVARGVGELGLVVADGLDEGLPHLVQMAGARDLAVDAPRARRGTRHPISPGAQTDDPHSRRQLAIDREVVERGNQLAVGQVAGRTENHHRARLRQRTGDRNSMIFTEGLPEPDGGIQALVLLVLAQRQCLEGGHHQGPRGHGPRRHQARHDRQHQRTGRRNRSGQDALARMVRADPPRLPRGEPALGGPDDVQRPGLEPVGRTVDPARAVDAPRRLDRVPGARRGLLAKGAPGRQPRDQDIAVLAVPRLAAVSIDGAPATPSPDGGTLALGKSSWIWHPGENAATGAGVSPTLCRAALHGPLAHRPRQGDGKLYADINTPTSRPESQHRFPARRVETFSFPDVTAREFELEPALPPAGSS
jgi:hypothetical protein